MLEIKIRSENSLNLFRYRRFVGKKTDNDVGIEKTVFTTHSYRYFHSLSLWPRRFPERLLC